MAVEITSAIWASDDRFSGSTLLLLIRLGDWANVEGICWPAISTLAKFTRLSERQVQRILRQLETEGVLEIENRGDEHRSNTYRIVVSKLGRVTPASPSGNVTLTLTSEAKNSAEMSPQPSGSINEPSTPPAPPSEGDKFVDWFLGLLSKTSAPEPKMTSAIRALWIDTFDKLQRIDGKTKAQIWKACEWARNDNFWRGNFYAPTKLRERKDGVLRIDQFLHRLANPQHATSQKSTSRSFSESNLSAFEQLDREMASRT